MLPHLFSSNSDDGLYPGPYPIKEPKYKWVEVQTGASCFPKNMFCVGHIETGEKAFVARATVNEARVPGYMIKSTGLAYIPHEYEEHTLKSYEVLVVYYGRSEICWEGDTKSKNYNLIALKAGKDKQELTLVGRTAVSEKTGLYRFGKVKRSQKQLYVPINGQEMKYDNYETLVIKSSPTSLFQLCCWDILNQMAICGTNTKEKIDGLPLPHVLKESIKQTAEPITDEATSRRPMFIMF